jgi:hypothetical protein
MALPPAKPYGKPLPKGWVYLLTRRDVRALCEVHRGIRRVELIGPHGKPSRPVGGKALSMAGTLIIRGTENGWRCKLQLSGLPRSTVGDQYGVLREHLLREVKRTIAGFEGRPSNPMAKATELHFSHWHEAGVLRPQFHRRPMSTFFERMAQDDPWWED